MNLANFFSKYPFNRILLGLSGGSDSIALLHLLLSIKEKCSLEIGIAHIDHGWRAESKQEALLVEEIAFSYQLPFFIHRPDFSTTKGNLENESRKERLAFFKKICQEKHYSALILAHHADDQAETVLKRCLEGAGIFALHGIEESSDWEGMTILRPLLNVSKKNLIDFLEQKKIAYFKDPTNLDPRFLRGRMRKDIFPVIDAHFGKNIRLPLCRLANSSLEMKDYVSKQVKAANIELVKCDFGEYADLSPLTHSVEIKWFLGQFFKNENCTLSQDQFNIAVKCILEKKANRKLEIQKNTVYFDRGYFFYFRSKKPTEIKEFCCQPWKLKFEKFKRGDTELLGWKSVFSGQCRAILPFGNYALGLASQETMAFLDRLWNQQKVPAFLRSQAPVLYDEHGAVVHEFLSGKKLLKSTPKGDEVTVSLYREY